MEQKLHCTPLTEQPYTQFVNRHQKLEPLIVCTSCWVLTNESSSCPSCVEAIIPSPSKPGVQSLRSARRRKYIFHLSLFLPLQLHESYCQPTGHDDVLKRYRHIFPSWRTHTGTTSRTISPSGCWRWSFSFFRRLSHSDACQLGKHNDNIMHTNMYFSVWDLDISLSRESFARRKPDISVSVPTLPHSRLQLVSWREQGKTFSSTKRAPSSNSHCILFMTEVDVIFLFWNNVFLSFFSFCPPHEEEMTMVTTTTTNESNPIPRTPGKEPPPPLLRPLSTWMSSSFKRENVSSFPIVQYVDEVVSWHNLVFDRIASNVNKQSKAYTIFGSFSNVYVSDLLFFQFCDRPALPQLHVVYCAHPHPSPGQKKVKNLILLLLWAASAVDGSFRPSLLRSWTPKLSPEERKRPKKEAKESCHFVNRVLPPPHTHTHTHETWKA